MQTKISKLALWTMPCFVALSLGACGGSSSSSSSDAPVTEDIWAELSDIDADSIVTVDTSLFPELKEGCQVPQGALIVSGDVYDNYFAWIWDEKGNNLYDGAEWPGKEFTDDKLSTCAAVIHFLNPPKSIDNMSVIVNAGKDKNKTGNGNVYNQKYPCLKISSEADDKINKSSFVSARECGVSVEGLSDEIPTDVYVKVKDEIKANGSVIEIKEIEGKEGSGYVTLTLLVKGDKEKLESNPNGKFWFGDNEGSPSVFTNGQKLIVGKNVKVNEGESKETVLHVQYGEGDNTVSVSYKIVKTYSVKNEQCRLNKQKETLGATYAADNTVFRIWSPDSSDVKVEVDGTSYDMTKSSLDCYTDVYETKVDGNLAGKTYQFVIGGKKARDPYGKMVAKGSDTANIVMDMSQTEPEEWFNVPELKNREDSIVYEVHVRDFTIDDTSGVDADRKGRYLGMVQTGTFYNNLNLKTGIDHLKELGVTHVQLQPIYDYGTCSEVGSQDSSCYNWGYDPWNYNVPEDRYSLYFGTDKYNDKIKEVKTMINEFHKNGIRVIMDVVYNHNWKPDMFKDITSKYYLSQDITGCGNTIDANNNMVWTMIRDSMDYWVSEFHVDGFRLDLVGAFGMKDFSDWGEYLNKQYPKANLLIYGEPWAADNEQAEKLVEDPVRTGRMFLQSSGAHVGAFNNRFRNCIKGGASNGDDKDGYGFLFNKLNKSGYDDNGSDQNGTKLKDNKECVFMGVKAGVRTEDAPSDVKDVWSAQGFSDPEQTVSYLTCHDNLALRDMIESYDGIVSESDDAKRLQAYGNSIVMISQGISFIHGGEEFGRTKAAAGKDKDNTYNTTTGANDFIWSLKSDAGWNEVYNSYVAYTQMRKEHPAFRMTNAKDINANVKLDEKSSDETVIININGKAVNDTWGTIKVVMNSSAIDVDVAGVEGMTKVADGKTVGDKVLDNNKAAAQSVSIWAVVNADTQS
ncbi:MAG: hypothetical protein K5752_01545 [Succinivibrionaceae bacterium]|nr:hypothetical protein [Succinivibrionaceae bacterium]